MRRLAVAFWACAFLCGAVQAGAQTQPASLATLFEDIYGPNGLVLSSEDVQLDGTNHAAHFNSAFQSDFRLVNIALTSQYDTTTLDVVAAFQRHFRPERVDGVADHSTLTTLENLLASLPPETAPAS